jgi:hypothetical protein
MNIDNFPVRCETKPGSGPHSTRKGTSPSPVFIEISSQNPGKYGEEMSHALSSGSVLDPLSPFHVIPSGQLAAASDESNSPCSPPHCQAVKIQLEKTITLILPPKIGL